MTNHTRSNTDNAQAARILAGLRERVARLEKQDRYTEDSARELHVRSESAHPDDTVTLEITASSSNDGFGNEPFGSDFGSKTNSSDPEQVETTTREITNTTVHGFHEYCAEAINPDLDAPAPPANIVLGDGTGQFSVENDALHNQLGATAIVNSSPTNNGRATILNADIGQNALTGDSIRELGVVAEDGRLLNHAPIDPPIEKTDGMEISIEIRMQIVDG